MLEVEVPRSKAKEEDLMKKDIIGLELGWEMKSLE